MRDQDNCVLTREKMKSFDEFCFSFSVQGAGCFIQNQKRWVMIQSACEAKTLALAAGKSDASFAHYSLKAARQVAFDEIENLSRRTGFTQPRTVDLVLGNTQRDIARDRVVDEENILRHVADGSLPGWD